MYRFGYFNRLSISAFPVSKMHSVLHLTSPGLPQISDRSTNQFNNW